MVIIKANLMMVIESWKIINMIIVMVINLITTVILTSRVIDSNLHM